MLAEINYTLIMNQASIFDIKSLVIKKNYKPLLVLSLKQLNSIVHILKILKFPFDFQLLFIVNRLYIHILLLFVMRFVFKMMRRYLLDYIKDLYRL